MKTKILLPLLFLFVSVFPVQGQSTLWKIGTANQNYREFALSGDGYTPFKSDGFFVVGDSDPSTDWPFVHPGPIDGWAGSRTHTFTILFGVGSLESGVCRLIIDLVDTHSSQAPLVNVIINDNFFQQKLPMGAGDESIKGQPAKGKHFQMTVEFPSHMLHPGNNEIEIVNSSGSWFLYDAIALETPSAYTSTPVKGYIELGPCTIEPAILKVDGAHRQNLLMTVKYAGGAKRVEWWYNNSMMSILNLTPGIHQYRCQIPEIIQEQNFTSSLKVNKKDIASSQGWVKPTGHKTIYILPHSHTDIGYTDIQTSIEEKQVENLREGIRFARETADYPEGAGFVWNVEVSWAADLYLNRLGEKEQEQFFDAVTKGWISINGMYLNELTGLCRPEELLRLFRYSTQLAGETGIPVDAAMISDVPGYTWGTVTAMAQAGIRYFSVAPNYFDRIGDILVQWENKPFYWVGPSGKEKVLVWIPFKGYAWSHTIPELNDKNAADFLSQLEKLDYPYDIAYMRWSGHGDNSVPEPQICDFVRDWNAKYAWPRFIISSTSEAFRAFESAYGSMLEEVRGDWTPYWEDGAGSSALETGINRNTADRLTQAAALFALTDPKSYPSKEFDEAWKQTLLYSEHTWGAWCSITDPENKMTVEQWDIKRGYAEKAQQMSIDLLHKVVHPNPKTVPVKVIVSNSCGWERSEPVILPASQSVGIQSVLDESDRPVPFQRLQSGEMMFIPPSIPGWSQVVFTLSSKPSKEPSSTSPIIHQNVLDNGLLRVELDPATGNILSLFRQGIQGNLADSGSRDQMNQYLFLEGNDLNNLQTNSACHIDIKENGPVFGILEVRSTAPGCRELVRRYSLAAGMDYLMIENRVDKERAPMPEKIGDWYLAQNKNKESVNFAFPFHVPEGVMRLDLPIGSMVPWQDQMPSACKNWFTVGRYGDISNDEYGVTWFTLDAPLVEVGEISATLLGSQTDPTIWRKEVKPTQTLYSWAMNNHWGTNYRQYQEGVVSFRYAIRPHATENQAEAYRIATGLTQPLVVQSSPANHFSAPFILDGNDLVPISLKPADNGTGYILRLYNPNTTRHSSLVTSHSFRFYLSNTQEQKLKELGTKIDLDGMELMTIRIE